MKRWLLSLIALTIVATTGALRQPIAQPAQALAAAPTPQGWEYLGPDGGEIDTLLVDHQRTLYGGTDSGWFRSLDLGDHWTRLELGAAAGEIGSLYLAPDDTLFAIAETGQLYRSADRGAAWAPIDRTRDFRGYRLVFSPDYATDRTLFGWGASLLLRSTDGGGIWETALDLVEVASFEEIIISPDYGRDLTLFTVALHSAWHSVGYLHKSSDGGQNWTLVWSESVSRIKAAVSPAYGQDQTLFIAAATNEDYGRAQDHYMGVWLMKSEDGGSSWRTVRSLGCSGYTYTGFFEATLALVISPAYGSDQSLLLEAWASIQDDPASTGGFCDTYGEGPYTETVLSTDGGNTWQAWDRDDDYTCLEFCECDPSEWWCRPRFLSLWPLELSPAYAQDHTAFSKDGSGHLALDANGRPLPWTPWDEEHWPLVFSPNYSTDHTIFAPDYRSTDAGRTWQRMARVGLSDLDVEALALSPAWQGDGVVFIGTEEGLDKSQDRGQTWQLTDAPYAEGLVLSPEYEGDGTLFVSGARSRNRGTSWSEVCVRGSLAISPDYENDGTVFGTYHYQNRVTEGQQAYGNALVRSTDQGESCEQRGPIDQSMPGGIGYGYCRTIAISPDYASDHEILAACQGPGLLGSDDGGDTWSWTTAPTSSPAMTFINPEDGWLVVPDVSQEGTDYYLTMIVLHTQDGGQTWRVQSNTTPAKGYYTIDLDALTVQFVDSQHGWILGDDLEIPGMGDRAGLWRTVDGGETWQLLDVEYNVQAMHFVDPLRGWLAAYGIWRTIDGGDTWTRQQTPSDSFYGLFFLDENLGWAVGLGGKVIRTLDGGETWLACETGSSANMRAVHFADAQHGWAVGGAGIILRSSDGGIVWTAQQSGSVGKLSQVHFWDAQRGMAAGDDLLLTTDGGQTWTVQRPLGSTERVAFQNGGRAWIANGSGGIARTIDGGLTWESDLRAYPAGAEAVAISPAFRADRTILLSANNGLFKSTDGGVFWQDMPLTHTVSYLALSPHYAQDQTLVAATSEHIWICRDGGSAWTSLNDGLPSLDVFSLAIGDSSPLTLYIGTSSGVWGRVLASPTSQLRTLAQDVGGYTGMADTYLHSWYPDTSYGGQGSLTLRGDGAARALLRFDLAGQLPPDAVVHGAALHLGVRDGGPSPMSVDLYRVLRPWSEGGATWQQAAAGQPWGSPGATGAADRASQPATTQLVQPGAGSYAFDITALVQQWLANPGANLGVLLQGRVVSGGAHYDLFSSEHRYPEERPRLEIVYSSSLIATSTPTYTVSPTPTRTGTRTPTQTLTPSPSSTFTPTGTATPTNTITPTGTWTATPAPVGAWLPLVLK